MSNRKLKRACKEYAIKVMLDKSMALMDQKTNEALTMAVTLHPIQTAKWIQYYYNKYSRLRLIKRWIHFYK